MTSMVIDRDLIYAAAREAVDRHAFGPMLRGFGVDLFAHHDWDNRSWRFIVSNDRGVPERVMVVCERTLFYASHSASWHGDTRALIEQYTRNAIDDYIRHHGILSRFRIEWFPVAGSVLAMSTGSAAFGCHNPKDLDYLVWNYPPEQVTHFHSRERVMSFMSRKIGNKDLIQTTDVDFIERWCRAHDHCMAERPLTKEDRIKVFRHYLYGEALPMSDMLIG